MCIGEVWLNQGVGNSAVFLNVFKTRLQDTVEFVGKPSETDSIKSQISSKKSRGKKVSTKNAIKDITSDSKENSYFPYRSSPASLAFNIYFYLFLYLYVTRIAINNGRSHLKSPKNQTRRAAFGRPAIKLQGGGGGGG